MTLQRIVQLVGDGTSGRTVVLVERLGEPYFFVLLSKLNKCVSAVDVSMQEKYEIIYLRWSSVPIADEGCSAALFNQINLNYL